MTLWFSIHGDKSVEVHVCTTRPEIEGDFAVIPSDMVCSDRIIRIAIERTLRAFENGINRARHPSREFLRFFTGERQISRALDRVKGEAKSYVVVLFGQSDFRCSYDGPVPECPLGKGVDSCASCPRRVWASWGMEDYRSDTDFERILLENGAFVVIEKDV